jgi:hypothetical protein
MNHENTKMIDVLSSFERQSDDATVIEFAKEGWSLPSGGHLQGIQRVDVPSKIPGEMPKEYFIISGSSDSEAYFIVVGRTSAGYSVVQKKMVCADPYRHAGGIQIIGDYLVVGVEDNLEKDRSQVYFLDIANPEKPIGDPIITIQRKGAEKRATAGAVAIVKRVTDHLLIVGSWDSDTLDFYESNGVALGERDPKGKSKCEFTYWRTWNKNDACKKDWCDDTWGSYQNLNLISDVNDRLFLLGYYCTAEEEEDYVDLYSLDLSKPSSEMIKKESSKRVKCKGGASFKYGGGVYIKDEKSLMSYACERNCRGKTIINEFC